MKRILFLFVGLIIFNSGTAQINTWRVQNPSFQPFTLHGVQMLSLNHVFSCGEQATVIRTNDGGTTWDVKNRIAGLYITFYCMNFLDDNFGLIGADSGLIFRTVDGGDNWEAINTNIQTHYTGIVIVDKRTALAVSFQGNIIRSTDGGSSWLPVSFEIPEQFTNIRKLNLGFITIAGKHGALYKSTDQGRNWQKIPLTSDTTVIGNDIIGQVFFDNYTAELVGDLGGIFRTMDGGAMWTRQTLVPPLTAELRSIDGKGASTFSAVGDYGTVINTQNGGTSWTRMNLGITDTLLSISYYDRYNAFAVGEGGVILRTVDGGASWTFVPSRPLTDRLGGVAFFKGDTSLGIAVGHYGTILRTTNGGEHWDRVNSGTTEDLSAIMFKSTLEAFAVGDHGAIVRTNDGGVSWTPRSSGTTKLLRAVNFPSPLVGFAVGDSGIVISTTNGGTTWTTRPFTKKRSFTGVAFYDDLHGYITSDHGVYRTKDGGATWIAPDLVTYYMSCTAVAAPSANVVCVPYYPCDVLGSVPPAPPYPPAGILMSYDGGENWVNHEFPPPSDYTQWPLLNSVAFEDDLHGTTVGGYYRGPLTGSRVYHTNDGGKNWVQQFPDIQNGLYGVSFGTKQAGTAVGYGGVIIRITTNE
ncbi:MAG: YCF48-related protein [bacterium]